MNTVYLSRKDATVDQIIKAAFPSFTGQKVHARISPTVEFYGTMWDEGNRRSYVVLNLKNPKPVHVPTEPFLQDSPDHQKTHAIPDGCVVVVHVQGRSDHIEIITPTNNITPALEQNVPLTDDEKIVLNHTKSLKSSYGGISNYRFHEANRTTGITLTRWNEAKSQLITKKLLNKAGAITIEGRNANS